MSATDKLELRRRFAQRFGLSIADFCIEVESTEECKFGELDTASFCCRRTAV